MQVGQMKDGRWRAQCDGYGYPTVIRETREKAIADLEAYIADQNRQRATHKVLNGGKC